MPIKDPIIVLGLTGEVDTIAPHAEALEKAGLSHMRYAEATAGMSAIDKHNALVDLAQAIRTEQPTARFLVFKESLRPLVGAKPMPDGTLSFGSTVPRSIEELKRAKAEVRAFEITQPAAAKPAQRTFDTGIFPPDDTPAPAAAEPSFPHWSPFVVAKQAKKPSEPTPKPKILVLYYQACNGQGIVKNPKAELTHAMVVPKDVAHTDFLTKEALPELDSKMLGRLHAHAPFLKEMVGRFGESFWSNKKFDTAIATAEELHARMREGGYDGVVVVGPRKMRTDMDHKIEIDRKRYALLPENIEAVLEDTSLANMPFVRVAHGSDDLVNDTRVAISDVVDDCRKASAHKPAAADIVQQALAKARGDFEGERPVHARVRKTAQTPATRALQPTRPAVQRSRNNHPHVLVLYAPGTSDTQLHSISTGVDMDKALLLDADMVGNFVNPDGVIQRSALTDRKDPLSFVRYGAAHFGEGFHRHIQGIFSTPDQLTTYLGKRRPHGSARDTKAYDEVVIVGDIPEGFALSHAQIEAACAAHKNNKGERCVVSQVADIAGLHARFPVASIDQTFEIG